MTKYPLLTPLIVLLTASLYSIPFHATANCSLTASWELWEPYQYQEGQNITGLDNDLLTAIFAHTDCDLNFVKRPWARALKEIEEGLVDLAPGASINEQREKYAYFSLPYRVETMVLMVRKGAAASYLLNSLQDITHYDFKLGVVRDYYYGAMHKESLNNVMYSTKIAEVENDTANIQKLVNKRIDGLLIDHYVGTFLAKRLGLLDQIEVHPLKINSDNIYLMISKKSVSQDTVTKINDGLLKLKQMPLYDQILKQYLE